MKNTLNIEVTRPNQVLYIMRGIPGGGKSTKAKTLVGEGIIHSTDDVIEATGDYRAFFATMIASGNFSALHKAHTTNFNNARKSMLDGISPIVIDNTNIKSNEPKKYVTEALSLGYADDNIIIVDIGTGNSTAEALAARNKHGVPLDKIEQMIKAYNSTGPLTLKKILNSKDMFKPKTVKVLYSAVVLTEKSRSKLLETLASEMPAGWDVFAHHMTVVFGKELSPELKPRLNQEVTLKVTHVGSTDKAMSVKVDVEEAFKPVSGKQAHVTVAVNTKDGGKPVMGGDIDKWVPVDVLELTGIVTEVKTTS